MEFWRWLTSTDGLPVLVAIIGLLGTAMAVIATIVTQILLGKQAERQEQERLNWEREKWKQEQRNRLILNNLERNRELFAMINNELHSAGLYMRLETTVPESIPRLTSEPGWIDIDHIHSGLKTYEWMLNLTAPRVSECCKRLYRYFQEYRDAQTSEQKANVYKGKIAPSIQECIKLMREDIGVADLSSEAHNQPQLNKAPMRGNNKSGDIKTT